MQLLCTLLLKKNKKSLKKFKKGIDVSIGIGYNIDS